MDDDAASRDGNHTTRHTRTLRVVASLAGILLVAAAVAVAFAVTSGPTSRTVSLRKRAVETPDFQLPDLRDESNTLTRTQFAGRPLVINFWASWCVPCRREMPALQGAFRAAGGDIAVIGIATRDGPSAARKFADRVSVHYPLALDPGGRTAEAFGVRGLPTTVFLDRQGREVARRLGEISREELGDTLRRLYGRS